ncbi:MAG: flagellar hook-length control protein FliK [Propionibacteriales bacterium]|nr:flagellar hook-length control protein FliK [Propionibacteriales bacterium]
MSIAPFLPAPVAPTPAEAGTPTDAQPGADGEVAFMDALAAALAVMPAPTPAAPSVEAPAMAPNPPLVEEVAQQPSRDPLLQTPAVAPEIIPSQGLETGRETALLDQRPAPAPVPALLAPAVPATPALPATTSSAATAAAPATPVGELAQQPSRDPLSPAGTGRPELEDGAQQPSRDAVSPSTAGRRELQDLPGPGTGRPHALLEQRPAGDQAAVPPTAAHNSRLETPNVPPQAPISPTSRAETGHLVERAVVTQVFPEITRLVSSGNGTHRITLTLQPAQLGEVRVTLVVRDGAVRVRMSGEAGDSVVRQALATGAPELQRMLERAGATEARVLVRDPSSAMPLPATAAPTRADAGPTWSGPSGEGNHFGQSDQPAQSGQSRGEHRDSRPGHPYEQGGRHAAAPGVVPLSTPTPGRLDRNL